jgi:hypothetical protein
MPVIVATSLDPGVGTIVMAAISSVGVTMVAVGVSELQPARVRIVMMKSRDKSFFCMGDNPVINKAMRSCDEQLLIDSTRYSQKA